ncbi:MAG TPA: Hsp20/alpha crystallin family protein, partial [Pseudonocardia sp.]|nr:Hsp20/alpha crystallin family protein [Pseudonocardia sp.]
PEGASEADISATYKDGLLEIRVPVPPRPTTAEPTRIAVTKG